ncbi:hypothetical protein D1AOALGA4SA_5355 [Olavius algarvensis Delta 1 endosymbiont]|nr:hypothetical protein D1AOALGA4SA_5355 [Olavius algarvensis Delta 1 endosymbiont]
MRGSGPYGVFLTTCSKKLKVFRRRRISVQVSGFRTSFPDARNLTPETYNQ